MTHAHSFGLNPCWVHGSVADHDGAKHFRQCVSSGAIDPSLHYGTAEQARRWLEVHRKHSPVSSGGSFEALYREVFAGASKPFFKKRVCVVSVGPGGSEKDVWLLEALKKKLARPHYVALDVSLDLAMASHRKALSVQPERSVPVAARWERFWELQEWLDENFKRMPRLFSFLGIFPNQLPSEAWSKVSSILRPRDVLLASFNLIDPDHAHMKKKVMAQYDNAETREWLAEVFRGNDYRCEGKKIKFEWDEIDGVPAVCASIKPDKKYPPPPTGEIRVFFSMRYTSAIITGLSELAGFVALNSRVSDCHQEGVWAWLKG